MLKANRLVAEAGFFGPRNPELIRRFQTMGTHATPSLEQQIELGMVLCGGPDTMVAQLRRLREDLGAGMVSLNFAGSTFKMIELFGHEVLPRMHAL